MAETVCHRMKMLVTVVDRRNGEDVVATLKENGFHYNMMLMGRGTVPSELIDLLGLGDTAKSVILSFVLTEKIPQLLHTLRDDHRFCEAGSGIAFTVPMDGIGGPTTLKFLSQLSSEAQREGNEYGI